MSDSDLILVRYGELALKGKNRLSFERKLVENMKAATAAIAPVRYERSRGRITAGLKRPEELPGDPRATLAAVGRRLLEVPGISSVSTSVSVGHDPEEISAVVNAALLERLEFERGPVTFRIATRRSDKRYPLTSVELDRFVATRLPVELWGKLKVELKHPELEIGIEVRSKGTFVYLGRQAGVGGLPVGTQGRALCLLSGGIDSPVAAWYAMRRGCRTDLMSFLSPPYIGAATRAKLIDLGRRIGRFQPRTTLHLAPFTEIQETIRDRCPAPYRTVLYRRFMQRIGSRVARRGRMRALITGESIGQVASQTLENIACIEEAASLPVLRPLIGMDKTEAIDLARRIGTFDISRRPEPDCCTVFMPDSPVIYGRLEECLAAEAELDVEGLVKSSLKGIEKVELTEGG
jgi:thiamine biosynthesis protein ThiI